MDLNPDTREAAALSVTEDLADTDGAIETGGNGSVAAHANGVISHNGNGHRRLVAVPDVEDIAMNGNGDGRLRADQLADAEIARVDGRLRPVAKATVSLVIPAKNEARNIAWVLRLLPDYIDEVILVDGNSTDDTIDVARSVRPDIVVVTDERPGKGAALRAGFAAATSDLIVMIDADGSMDPGEIDRYVQMLEDGFDLVKGSRFMEGGGTADISHVRRMGNGVLRGLVNALYGQRFTELCYGMMAFRAGRLDDLALKSDGFEIETEIVVRAIKAGLRIGEVPSFELPRRYGDSNLNAFRDGRRVLFTLLSHRRGFRRRDVEGADAVVPELAPAPAFESSTP
jgi:Glycosyl transferase family 2